VNTPTINVGRTVTTTPAPLAAHAGWAETMLAKRAATIQNFMFIDRPHKVNSSSIRKNNCAAPKASRNIVIE
jgi:hypothetical protein